MHRKSRRLLENIVILSIENPQSHTDNARKYGAQKIADTLCTRMLGKSPVCQNSGVGKKAKCWEAANSASSGAKSKFPGKKKLSSRCSSRVWQDARENISQKELLVWGLSPVGVELTTYCLGERKSVRFRVPPSAYIFPNFNVFHHFRMFAFPPKTACFTLFVLAEC